MKTVRAWLVVMYDRHVDDVYHCSTSLEGAKAAADAFMSGYGKRYEWTRDNEFEFINEDHKTSTEWVYRYSTFKDGPRLHIQLIDLEVKNDSTT